MKISTIRGLQRYLKRYSNFSGRTVNSVIFALGYHPQNEKDGDFKNLSCTFENCAENGASGGYMGFYSYSETIAFFKKHRIDIVQHMEQAAEELGTDIISMVQNFGVFYRSQKPTTSEVGKALWGRENSKDNFNTLYNVFAWYALEEVSRTWYRYLEDNPAYWEKLSA
jgi:hypothetical protein